jgi:hypothetical protein
MPLPTLSRRALLRGTVAAAAVAVAGCATRSATPPPSSPPGLRLLGETILPHHP